MRYRLQHSDTQWGLCDALNTPWLINWNYSRTHHGTPKLSLYQLQLLMNVKNLPQLRIKCVFFCLEEPVYRYEGRRKSVFAEAYDPEDDEGKDDVKVKLNFIEKDKRWNIQILASLLSVFRLSTPKQMSKDRDWQRLSRTAFSSGK